MNFIEHSNLNGLHAFLGASKYNWVNYDDEKLIATYEKHLATMRGTELHEFAAQCIRLREKLASTKIRKTLNMYVNDAIGFKMKPEQVLYYSDNCFGTADAISFRNGQLRIHDLKTGVTPAHMEQLMIYAALFCLEYRQDPSEIDIELRIYQSDEIIIANPTGDEIKRFMEKIVRFDKLINKMKLKEM